MTSKLDLSKYDLAQYDTYEEAMSSFEWSIPDKFNMGTALIDANAVERNRVAIFWDRQDGPNETRTYWQLIRRTNQFSNMIAGFGIETGDVVGVCLPERPETIVSHTGTWKRRAVCLPLPVILGSDGFEYRLADSGCKLLIVHAEYLETVRVLYPDLDRLQPVVVLGDAELTHDIEHDFTARFESQPVTATPAETAPDDDALLVYTSETTGDQKGVLHGHRLVFGILSGFYMKFNLDIDGVYYTVID